MPRVFLIAMFFLGILLVGAGAQRTAWSASEPEPVVLRAYSAFPKGHVVNRMYEPFLDALPKRTNGGIRIRWIGGPESIPPFEAIDPLRTGVIDLAFLPTSYYEDRVPEAGTDGLYQGPVNKVMRNNPAAEMHHQILRETVNVELLGYLYMYSEFYMIGNRTFKGTDLTGIRVRTGGQHLPWIQAMAGSGVRMPAAERYIGLERGVIDLAIAPITDIRDERLYEVSKYLIYPGFQDPRIGVQMNLDAFKRLSGSLRQTLVETALEFERKADQAFRKLVRESEDEILKRVKPFKLDPQDAQRFLELNRETIWKRIIQRSPDRATKLRQAFEQALGIK